MKPKTIKIDEVEYVRADSLNTPAQKLDGMKYVIVRSRDAGCHAGYLKAHNGDQVTLVHSRRLWSWQGALTLSELATHGPQKPDQCKFGCPITIIIIGACEIIDCTQKATDAITEVKEWK